MLRKALKRNLQQTKESTPKKKLIHGDNIRDKDEDVQNPEYELPEDKEKLLEVVVLGNTETHEEILKEDDHLSTTKNFQPAWQDDDDFQFTEDTGTESWVNNKTVNEVVEQKLRDNDFKETVGVAPEWAQIPDVNEASDSDDNLVSGSYVYSRTSDILPKDILEFSQVKDANFGNKEGDLWISEFHKTAQIAMLVSSLYRLSLYQIDGKLNPKLHSLYLENFPVKCGHFLQNGEDILLTSSRKSFLYNYNIISGKLTVIKKPLVLSKGEIPGPFKVAPNGNLVTILTSSGKLHLMSSASKEIVTSFQANDQVIDFDYVENGEKIISLSNSGRFHLWDVRMQACCHSFADESLFGPTNLAVSPDNKYVACGSKSGIVSLYDDSCFKNEDCIPVKEFKNLRTTISSLCFNSTSEILAMGSEGMKNSIKLIQMKALTAFSNFPINSEKNNQKIRLIDFSPNSGYMLNGTANGRALLYRLHHYKGY